MTQSTSKSPSLLLRRLMMLLPSWLCEAHLKELQLAGLLQEARCPEGGE